jgi:hypothetical protein
MTVGCKGAFCRLWRCDLPNIYSCEKEPQMLKFCVKIGEAVQRLRTDKDGVISFEYVVLAACIVGVVLLVFGTGNTSVMYQALNNAINTIAGAVNVQISP